MSVCYLSGIGLVAPGLPDWSCASAVLAGRTRYREQPLAAYKSALLPANERRRIGQAAKLALAAAEAALRDAGLERPPPSVFASSSGDCDIVDKICSALLLPERPVSPTQFHNSVHNAPAGYWSIATGSRDASLSVSAYDGSFAAGLLEAVAWLTDSERALLVAYDQPPPEPLLQARPLLAPFAVALLLARQPDARSRWRLRLMASEPQTEPTLEDAALERLRSGNPAARSLPLLQALACGVSASVVLPYLDHRSLQVGVEPHQ